MATNYPTSKQTFTDPDAADFLNSPSHSGLHSDKNDTLEAIQDKLGIGTDTTPGTADYFLKADSATESNWFDLFGTANTWTATQTFGSGGLDDSYIDVKIDGVLYFQIGADYSDGQKFKVSGAAGFGSADLLTFSETIITLNDQGADVDTIIESENENQFFRIDASADLLRMGDFDTNYIQVAVNGDMTFVGSAGFYPRTLNQSAEPAAGTGATQLDTSEICIWTDTDDSKCYICYNHGGTVKTVELI